MPLPDVIPSAGRTGPLQGPPPGGGDRGRLVLAAGIVLLVLVGGGVAASKLLLPTFAAGPAAEAGSTAGTAGGAAPGSTAPATGSPGETASGATSGYATYTDPRFAFTVVHPAGFVAQPQNSSSGGLEWAGGVEGMVTERAFGQNNTDGRTIADEEATHSKGMQLRYSHINGRILTMSGFVDGGKTIVYVREVVGPGSTNTLQWTYPADQKAQWDADVVMSARTFVPGDLSVPH